MASYSQRGAKVVSITAKDKLRQQLGKNLDLGGGSGASLPVGIVKSIAEADGVRFKNHLDGRELFLGPREAMRIQEALGPLHQRLRERAAPERRASRPG